ncbi:MAG: 2-C-methyl-D-erythritol 4-phosphate cytidylyltransferase [Cellulosilyticaceae bacterium]
MGVAAIIVAGGSGKRMGTTTKKQYLHIHNKEIIAHTVEQFEKNAHIEEIIVVTGKEDISYVKELLTTTYGYQKIKKVVEGGAERQHSVYNGLKALSEDMTHVLIHDGARPLITQSVIERTIEVVKEKAACIVAVPVKDTIKQAGVGGLVEATPKRELLWSVQTPQAFTTALILKAHGYAEEHQILGTDDSMLVEAMGSDVYIVEGDYTNIKITTPEDLVIAERLIEEV